MTPLVFIDTETDGIHPGRRVWEVAMIRRDDRGEQERSFFVSIDLRSADPYGLQVGGFYDRHPQGVSLSTPPPWPPTTKTPGTLAGVRADAPSPEELAAFHADQAKCQAPVLSKEAAARTVAKWTHGAHLVGVNPGFDAETLAKLLRGEGLIEAWHYHLVDVAAMAYGAMSAAVRPLPSPVTLPWKSDELSRAWGVEPPSEEERHTALGDARWALRWYAALTGGAA